MPGQTSLFILFLGGKRTFLARTCSPLFQRSAAQKCTNDKIVIQQYLSHLIGSQEFDADTVHGQLCACKTQFCNNLHFTNTVISQTERQISQAEGHTAPSERYTSEAERHTSEAERHTSQGEWHSSYYTNSRRTSTTLHLEISEVTIVDNLSTPSLAAGPVKSNQMLISTLSVLCVATGLIH